MNERSKCGERSSVPTCGGRGDEDEPHEERRDNSRPVLAWNSMLCGEQLCSSSFQQHLRYPMSMLLFPLLLSLN